MSYERSIFRAQAHAFVKARRKREGASRVVIDKDGLAHSWCARALRLLTQARPWLHAPGTIQMYIPTRRERWVDQRHQRSMVQEVS